MYANNLRELLKEIIIGCVGAVVVSQPILFIFDKVGLTQSPSSILSIFWVVDDDH